MFRLRNSTAVIKSLCDTSKISIGNKAPRLLTPKRYSFGFQPWDTTKQSDLGQLFDSNPFNANSLNSPLNPSNPIHNSSSTRHKKLPAQSKVNNRASEPQISDAKDTKSKLSIFSAVAIGIAGTVTLSGYMPQSRFK